MDGWGMDGDEDMDGEWMNGGWKDDGWTDGGWMDGFGDRWGNG